MVIKFSHDVAPPQCLGLARRRAWPSTGRRTRRWSRRRRRGWRRARDSSASLDARRHSGWQASDSDDSEAAAAAPDPPPGRAAAAPGRRRAPLLLHRRPGPGRGGAPRPGACQWDGSASESSAFPRAKGHRATRDPRPWGSCPLHPQGNLAVPRAPCQHVSDRLLGPGAGRRSRGDAPCPLPPFTVQRAASPAPFPSPRTLLPRLASLRPGPPPRSAGAPHRLRTPTPPHHRPHGPPQTFGPGPPTRRSPMLTFATKMLSTSANGQKAAASRFARAVLIGHGASHPGLARGSGRDASPAPVSFMIAPIMIMILTRQPRPQSNVPGQALAGPVVRGH